MWKRILNSAKRSNIKYSLFLLSNQIAFQQVRTTFILRRQVRVGLYKKGLDYKSKLLKTRHFVYDLVEDTDLKKPKPLEVILTEDVPGFGNRGARIIDRPNLVYHKLLLPGYAVYASPENVEKFTDKRETEKEKPKYSSPFAAITMSDISKYRVCVYMNKETPWTLEPWHVRTSFLKAGIYCPKDAISLPEAPIIGPNMDYEGKFFEVTVTINKVDQTRVKCWIHHWSTDLNKRLPPLVGKLSEIPEVPLFSD